MSWAVERDKTGLPMRLWYMGVPPKPVAKLAVRGCPCCGLHFGWHKMGCEKRRTGQPAAEP